MHRPSESRSGSEGNCPRPQLPPGGSTTSSPSCDGHANNNNKSNNRAGLWKRVERVKRPKLWGKGAEGGYAPHLAATVHGTEPEVGAASVPPFTHYSSPSSNTFYPPQVPPHHSMPCMILFSAQETTFHRFVCAYCRRTWGFRLHDKTHWRFTGTNLCFLPVK